MNVYDLVTVESKDETMAHTLRVVKLVRKYGIFLDLSERDLHSIIIGALYHDRGKKYIPKRILYKQEALTANEYEIIQGHVINHGIRWENDDIQSIIMQHHERENGSGYPIGLKGDQIHRLAKILAIVDVYDALTAVRSYKKALSVSQALNLMASMPLNKCLFLRFCEFLSFQESRKT